MKDIPLYQKLGYLGTAPFILCAAGLLATRHDLLSNMFALIALGYGGMILSFLAGVHWAHALPKKNKRQMILAMIPTIICLALFVLPVILRVYSISLFLLAFGFLAMYVMDKRYLVADWLPGGYMVFRRKITLIVFFCLLVSIAAVSF